MSFVVVVMVWLLLSTIDTLIWYSMQGALLRVLCSASEAAGC